MNKITVDNKRATQINFKSVSRTADAILSVDCGVSSVGCD